MNPKLRGLAAIMTNEIRTAIGNATWCEDIAVRTIVDGHEERCLIGDYREWHFIIVDIRTERRRAEGFVRKNDDAKEIVPLHPELAMLAVEAAEKYISQHERA